MKTNAVVVVYRVKSVCGVVVGDGVGKSRKVSEKLWPQQPAVAAAVGSCQTKLCLAWIDWWQRMERRPVAAR